MPVSVNTVYNSLWQVRGDSWSSLEESTTQLALASAQQRPVEQLAETVKGLLEVLSPIERYWAFPGPRTIHEVQRLFAAGKYGRLAALVSRVNRALVTESYRNGRAWDPWAEDDAYDRESPQGKSPQADRPYFEVLIAEDMTEEQENSLREELRRWRRPDDQFVYEIVVVHELRGRAHGHAVEHQAASVRGPPPVRPPVSPRIVRRSAQFASIDRLRRPDGALAGRPRLRFSPGRWPGSGRNSTCT